MRLAWLFPLKARSPVAISWSSAPKAKMSARASGSLPSSCSGAMYWNVPMRLPSAAKGLSPVASALSSEAAATGVSGALSFASPKSSSFAPDLVSMTFPGLRSRWTIRGDGPCQAPPRSRSRSAGPARGEVRAEMALASRSKRWHRSGLAARCGGRTLMATVRSRRVSRAR